MFKNFTSSFIISALVIFGVTTVADAMPATNSLSPKAIDASPDVTVCTGWYSTDTGCVTIPISDESCVSFVEGLSFLYKEVSSASIPDGLVCTFYENLSCESSQGGADAVVLQGGTWDFFSLPGTAGTVDFNDLSSSFICSTL